MENGCRCWGTLQVKGLTANVLVAAVVSAALRRVGGLDMGFISVTLIPGGPASFARETPVVCGCSCVSTAEATSAHALVSASFAL